MKKISRERLNELLKRLDSVAVECTATTSIQYGLPIDDVAWTALMREVVSDWLYEELWQKEAGR